MNDIELDIQELKCLLGALSSDAHPALREVARRSITQMKTRLDALQTLLDTPVPSSEAVPVAERTKVEVKEPEFEVKASEPEAKEPEPETKEPELEIKESEPELKTSEPEIKETKSVIEEHSSAIFGERIRPVEADSLRRSISLNDRFRFTRELFDGNAARMSEVVGRLGKASSLEEALQLFAAEVCLPEENEAAADFVELLKKQFN